MTKHKHYEKINDTVAEQVGTTINLGTNIN
jgi:hypothetical protein